MMKQSARFAGFAGRALLAGRYDVFVRGAVLVVISLALRGSAALAGGSAENALLLVDPRRDDSLYIANYYRAARDLPDRNLLYVDPAAPNYATFVNINHAALFGTLANAAIEDHIDYIIIAPGGAFYIPASGYVATTAGPSTG